MGGKKMFFGSKKKNTVYGYIYTKKKVSIEARNLYMKYNPPKMEWVVAGDASPSVYKGNYGTISINNNTGTAIVQFNFADQIVALDFLSEQVTSIDISQCVNIEVVLFYNNQLILVDVSNNSLIKNFNVGNNFNYSGLNLSQMPLLETLAAMSTKISGLLDFSLTPNINFINVSNCKLLTAINFTGCDKLTSLNGSLMSGLTSQIDISDCVNLTSFVFYQSKLGTFTTHLDLSNNVNLKTIDLRDSNFTTANFPSLTTLSELTSLNIYNNSITSLDISGNPKLKSLQCHLNGMPPTSTDSIITQLYNHGLTNGSLSIRDNRTSASDVQYNGLISRGWSITQVNEL